MFGMEEYRCCFCAFICKTYKPICGRVRRVNPPEAACCMNYAAVAAMFIQFGLAAAEGDHGFCYQGRSIAVI